MYGSCIVFYEKLTFKLHEPVNKTIQEWVTANISPSTVEYAQHLQEKIKAEQEKLAEAKKDYLSGAIEEQVKACQENIDLYKELLEPVKMGI